MLNILNCNGGMAEWRNPGTANQFQFEYFKFGCRGVRKRHFQNDISLFIIFLGLFLFLQTSFTVTWRIPAATAVSIHQRFTCQKIFPTNITWLLNIWKNYYMKRKKQKNDLKKGSARKLHVISQQMMLSHYKYSNYKSNEDYESVWAYSIPINCLPCWLLTFRFNWIPSWDQLWWSISVPSHSMRMSACRVAN